MCLMLFFCWLQHIHVDIRNKIRSLRVLCYPLYALLCLLLMVCELSLSSLSVHLLWYIGEKVEIIYNSCPTVEVDLGLVNWKMNKGKWNRVKIKGSVCACQLPDWIITPQLQIQKSTSTAEAQKLNLSIRLCEYNWHFINTTDGVIHKVQTY